MERQKQIELFDQYLEDAVKIALSNKIQELDPESRKSIAMETLWTVIDKYDETNGASFNTFLFSCIKSDLLVERRRIKKQEGTY